MSPTPRFNAERLREAAAGFSPTNLKLLSERALLRRVDSKFVSTVDQALEILPRLATHYTALMVESGPIATYDNLYFDTPDLVCYHDHRRGRRLRHRVRIRHYPDRQLSYLEVKSKQNDTVTDKSRIKIPYQQESLGTPELSFLSQFARIRAPQLSSKVRIDFSRVTLVGLETAERVTIDFGIRFSAEHRERQLLVSVFEIKQPAYCATTPIMNELRNAHIRPQSLSKYSTSIASLFDEKTGRLRPDLRMLDKIEQQMKQRIQKEPHGIS